MIDLHAYLEPGLLLGIMGILARAAWLLGNIRGQLEVLTETQDQHQKDITTLQTDVATIKGRIGYAKP